MNRFSTEELKSQVCRFFDKELNDDDQKELMSQIHSCPSSMNEFNREKQIREKLKQNVHRPPVSPGLADQIKHKLRG
ncbi:MAG TPA: hypothetical protein PK006_06790 [Saprospiraceae bacterium]|nr:hypothetical protein [Saprospiraceae bacterium]